MGCTNERDVRVRVSVLNRIYFTITYRYSTDASRPTCADARDADGAAILVRIVHRGFVWGITALQLYCTVQAGHALLLPCCAVTLQAEPCRHSPGVGFLGGPKLLRF